MAFPASVNFIVSLNLLSANSPTGPKSSILFLNFSKSLLSKGNNLLNSNNILSGLYLLTVPNLATLSFPYLSAKYLKHRSLLISEKSMSISGISILFISINL